MRLDRRKLMSYKIKLKSLNKKSKNYQEKKKKIKYRLSNQ